MGDLITIQNLKHQKFLNTVHSAMLPLVQNLNMYTRLPIYTLSDYLEVRRAKNAPNYYIVHDCMYLNEHVKEKRISWTEVSLKHVRGNQILALSINTTNYEHTIFSLYFYEEGCLTLRWSRNCRKISTEDIYDTGIQVTDYLNNCLLDELLAKTKLLINNG